MLKYSTIILLFISTWSFGQVTIKGTIKVNTGSQIEVIEDLQIEQDAYLNNKGTIVVSRDFTNKGTIVSDPASALRFYGDGNSNLLPGSGNYSNVLMNKTGATLGSADVRLQGNLFIEKSLDFTNGANTRIILDSNSISMSTSASTIAAESTKYIVTNGSGLVKQNINSGGAIPTFEVGDLTNYTPLLATLAPTAIVPVSGASISVKVVAARDCLPQATDYILRHWNVSATANILNYECNLSGKYVDSDINSNSSDVLIKGSIQNIANNEWFFMNSDGDVATNYITSSTTYYDTDFTGQNFFGKINSKVFLDGPFNDASNTMVNSLMTSNLVPTVSPYDNNISVDSKFFTDNPSIVDWVEIETKTASSPSTTVTKTSGFVMTDGRLMTVDGQNNTLYIKDSNESAYVIINHRNHLAVSTPFPVNLTYNPTIDFTDKNYTAYGTDARRLRTDKATLWAGDATGNGVIKYNGAANDRVAILGKVGFANPNNSVSEYDNTDINLDGEVKYNGSANDRVYLLSTVGFINPNKTISQQIPN